MRFWVILLKSWKRGCHGRDGGSPLHGTEGPPGRRALCRQPWERGRGSAGAHASALSACSNSGRSWMWRSFSMSGAPRWVLLAAGTVTASPGEGARGSWDAWGLLCLLSLLSCPAGPRHGVPHLGAAPSRCPTPAAGGPCGSLCPKRRREGRTHSAPPQHRQLVSLCVWMSLLYLPCFLCPFPRLFSQLTGDAGASAGTPGASGGPDPGSPSLHCGSLLSCASSPDSPPLSLCPHTLSLSLSVSFFLLFSSAHRVLGL